MNSHTPLLRGRSGFTLTELLAVIVILGILAQIAAPKLGGVLRVWKSRQAADQVAADFALARSAALRVGGDVHIVFDGTQRYRIEEGSGLNVVVHKSVNLATDFDRVHLIVPSGVTQVTFNSRGMARIGSGAYVVRTTADGVTRSNTLHLTALGMVRRAE